MTRNAIRLGVPGKGIRIIMSCRSDEDIEETGDDESKGWRGKNSRRRESNKGIKDVIGRVN